MSKLLRLNLRFPAQVTNYVDQVASEMGISRPAVLRRALGIMQATDSARKNGMHVGATRDRENLEVLIVGPV